MKSDFTTEFALSGGILDSKMSLGDQGFGAVAMIKGRYFYNNMTAIRGIFQLNNNSVTKNLSKGNSKETTTGFTTGLGVERHFARTERLSPYVGGDIFFNNVSESSDMNVTIGNFTNTVKVDGPNTSVFGLRGVVGADYYFLQHVYLGVEAGLGFENTEYTVTTTTSGSTSTTATVKEGSSNAITTNAVGGLRLGFIF